MTPIRRLISDPRPDALLRYVSGTSPLAEAESIRIWAAGDPDRAASIEELRAAWNQNAIPPQWDKGEVWDRLARHIPGAELCAHIDTEIGVSARSADPANAAAFIRYITQPEAAVVWRRYGLDR